MGKILNLISAFFVAFSTIVKVPAMEQNRNINGDQNISHAYLGDGITDAEYDNLLLKNNANLYIDDYYGGLYFKNLITNFGNNTHGTCTYVALGMLLSFYDTYWDDGFIEKKYEKKASFASNRQPEADFDLLPYNIASPGINFESEESVSNLTIEEYYNYIDSNSNTSFHMKLLQLSKEHFGTLKFDLSYDSFGMSYSETIDFLKYYLYDYRNYSTGDIKIYSSNGTQSEKEEFLKKYIRLGTPVLLRTNILGGHALIAYDYNDKTGEIYAHAGLRREDDNTSLTHVSLGELDSLDIWDVIAIEVNTEHNHSNNYVSDSGEEICSCNYIFPQKIELVSGNYKDTLPTFKWKSLYKEKWVRMHNPYFNFIVLDTYRREIFAKDVENNREYTLTQNEWDRLLFNSSEKSYYVCLYLCSNIYPYYDEYWTRELFNKPIEYEELPVIKPSEYGFTDSYPTDEITKTQYVEHIASNNFKFETRRYRTGYIHDEYIVMSPKRKGINEAYIEYRFHTAVTRIDVELAHWRDYSSEKLDSSNGKAIVEQFINNTWQEALDLLSLNLSTNRNNSKYYKVIFDQPVYRVRFYASTLLENTNDSNKGRICIGNIAFYPSKYSFPLSGYELDYEPHRWNNKYINGGDFVYEFVKHRTNCYSYAVDAQINPFTDELEVMNPGQSIGHDLSYDEIRDAETLLELIALDAAKLNFEFKSIGKNQKCPEGTYKVALFTDPIREKADYHWYRQNTDGTWSHKPGKTDVTDLDEDDKLIFDPEECNRYNEKENLNYTMFLGYYIIRPLKIYY